MWRVLAVAATALVLAFYLWSQVWSLAAPPPGSRDRHALGRIHRANDFKHLYFGARLLRVGVDPYDKQNMLRMAGAYGVSVNPYVYLPFTGQVLRPLTYLSLRRAIEVWFVCNHLFLLGAFFLIAQAWPPRWHLAAFLGLTALAALWFPLTRTLTAGQLGCALLFFLTLHWYAAERGWNVVAGPALAFAAMFKIAPFLLIVLLPSQRRWRLFFWSVGATVVFFAASVAACGFRRYLDFLPVARQMGYGKSTWPEVGFAFYRDTFNQSFNAFFHRTMTSTGYVVPWSQAGAGWANRLTTIATLLVVGLGVAAIVVGRRRARRRLAAAEQTTGEGAGPTRTGEGPDNIRSNDLDLAISLLLMLLIPSLYWDHYAVVLLLPMALILRSRPSIPVVAILIGCALVVAPPQAVFFNWSSRQGAGLLLFNMILWSTLALLVTAMALRLAPRFR